MKSIRRFDVVQNGIPAWLEDSPSGKFVLAADYDASSQDRSWQPIETMPERLAADVWIVSEGNENYGRRACGVCMVAGEWFGEGTPKAQYGEYATHWMKMPDRPATAMEVRCE